MSRVPPFCIGTMQGRLLPRIDGRVQAFPRDGWQSEFALAAEIGYGSLELTIETASVAIHPLLSAAGRAELAGLVRESGVVLAGLCCDTVMEHPLVDPDPEARIASVALTLQLLEAAGAAGLPMIELPMMGKNSLGQDGAYDVFAQVLDQLLPVAERTGVDVLLEIDVAPAAIRAFLDRIDHPRFGINYDSGNSTWFGFHPDEELPVYAPWVRNVHVKDCTRKDYSVALGQGETDFARVFAQLASAGYCGGFVLQAARRDGDDLAAARDYLAFTRQWVDGTLT